MRRTYSVLLAGTFIVLFGAVIWQGSAFSDEGTQGETISSTVPTTVSSTNMNWSLPIYFHQDSNCGGCNAEYDGTIDYLMDINGDGLVDMIEGSNSISAVVLKAYINNGNGTWAAPTNFPRYFKVAKLNFPDLNGDGLVDLLEISSDYCPPPNQTQRCLKSISYLNTSTGWTQTTTWNAPSILLIDDGVPEKSVRFTDVNNDGLSDLLFSYYISRSTANSTHGHEYQEIWLNTGSGWTLEYHYHRICPYNLPQPSGCYNI